MKNGKVKISKPGRFTNLSARFALRRIGKAYKRIDRLEASIDEDTSYREQAAKLRFNFASETIKRANQGLRERGVSRRDAKAYRRKIIRGDA